MSGPGIGRLVGRKRRLAAARRALGTLPQAQRRALALRYVSGLSPSDVAARLDLPLDEVETLLSTARGELLRAPRAPYARPLALTAAAAAVALVALPNTPSLVNVPGTGSPDATATVHVVGGEPLAFGDAAANAAPAPAALDGTVAARSAGEPGADVLDGRAPRTPRRGCRTLCVPETPHGHTLVVSVPDPVREPVGQKELVLEQGYVPLCEAFPTPPAGGASCVPAST